MTFSKLWRTYHVRRVYIYEASSWNAPKPSPITHIMLCHGKAPLCTEDMDAIKEAMPGPTFGPKPVVQIKPTYDAEVTCPACRAIAQSSMFVLMSL